jgi:signal transduction histidine kinase
MLVMAVVPLTLVVPWVIWGAPESGAAVYPVIAALFCAGRYAARPGRYLAVPIAVVTVLVQEWLDPLQTVAEGWLWSLNAVWVFALGAWLRQQTRQTDRAAALAAERERAAAAEARVAIARELHDVLAHSVSVMVLQAEVADELFETAPDRARAAIGSIQDVGRGALADTRRLVGALRAVEVAAPASPGATDLPALVDRFTAAGLPVDSHVLVPSGVPEPTGRTVYRVVQEALTNVLRHAGAAPTRLEVRADDGVVSVDVVNDRPVAAPTDGGTGHGLQGMRERVQALDGSVDAGPRPDGGFAVHARIPLR